MKKIIFSILPALAFVSSCSNDFISLLPPSNVTVNIMYQNDKDFADALIGTYNMLQDQYQDFWIFGDVRGDDSYIQISKNNKPSYSDLFTGTSNSDNGLVADAWRKYNTTIFRANTILQRIEPFDTATIPNKERYVGEARFIRALCYFDLVRIFGDVPAVTTPLSIEESYTNPRVAVATIYSQIIVPDLQAAETSLPASYTGAEIGKPTRGAAKALLGRVYLTLKEWGNAETKLTEVTNMGYSLLEDFNELFNYTQDEHHSEYIFDIEYEAGTEGSRFTSMFLPNSLPMAADFGITGYGEEWNGPTEELRALFDDNDRRKHVTVGDLGGWYDAAGEFHTLPTSTNQSYTMKYITPIAVRNQGPCNWKVIRYADVLLMLAEAMNENGKTALAIPFLNRVRTRAGVSEYPTTLSQAEARDAIAKERRLELSFEGVRWFDLLRTGKAFEVMASKGMQAYMTVWPIPLAQVQLINDNSIFPQNPGWD